VSQTPVGEPFDESTALGPLVSEVQRDRVRSYIEKGVEEGARLVTGGERDGAVVSPAIVADVRPEMAIARDELFGPAVAVSRIGGVADAIAVANDSEYGLAAGIFTSDVSAALRFARDVDCGNVMVNATPLWRADAMPYGGLKGSGIGKEGPRYAIEEMTELKTVVFHELDRETP
nr:aldehyde dehydrogenase family protein [Actinomycetota bacterium]